MVLCLDWLEDFLEAVSRIENDIAASSGKAAYLSGGFGQLVRCDRMSCGLNRPDCVQNIGRHQFTDGLIANPFIEQGNEPLFFLDIGRRVGILLGGEPFLGDNGERQRLFTRRRFGFFLGGFFLSAWVNVVGKQFLGPVPLAARVLQGDGGIRAKAERLSFSGIAVIHPP